MADTVRDELTELADDFMASVDQYAGPGSQEQGRRLVDAILARWNLTPMDSKQPKPLVHLKPVVVCTDGNGMVWIDHHQPSVPNSVMITVNPGPHGFRASVWAIDNDAVKVAIYNAQDSTQAAWSTVTLDVWVF